MTIITIIIYSKTMSPFVAVHVQHPLKNHNGLELICLFWPGYVISLWEFKNTFDAWHEKINGVSSVVSSPCMSLAEYPCSSASVSQYGGWKFRMNLPVLLNIFQYPIGSPHVKTLDSFPVLCLSPQKSLSLKRHWHMIAAPVSLTHAQVPLALILQPCARCQTHSIEGQNTHLWPVSICRLTLSWCCVK